MKLFLDANICLDLLDTTRPTSKASVNWYMSLKDDSSLRFYFSGDFITTFYYVLSERRKIDKQVVVEAIDALSMEIEPLYLNHTDFIEAKNSFGNKSFSDFEDLIILHSALRTGCDTFVTNDKALMGLKVFDTLNIEKI